MVNILHGKDVTGYGFRSTPLYFYFLDIFLSLFPVFVALKASASFVSAVIAVPFFFVMRRLTKRDDVALLATFLFTMAEGYSEMIAWGGIPNLLGIFFMLWSVYFTIVAMENHSKSSVILAGILLSLVIGTHHLTSFYYLFSIGLFTVLFLTLRRREAFFSVQLLVGIALTGALFSLPYLPIYMNMYASRAGAVLEFNISQCLHVLFGEALGAIGFIFRGALLVWSIIAAICFFEFWSRKARRARFASTYVLSLALTCFVLMFLISENPTRPLYFLYIPILIAFGMFLSNKLKHIEGKPMYVLVLFLVFLILISSFLVTSSYSRLNLAIDYYHQLHDEGITALDWLRENTESDAAVAVFDTPLKPSSRWSWWVEGYAERKAFMRGDLKFFIYEDERRQVDIANKIFSGCHVLDNGYLRVSDAFPVATINPEIWVNLGTKFQNVFFFTDSNITSEDAPRYIENGTLQLNHTNENATITYNYMKNLTVVNRTVELKAGKPYVDMVYNVTFPNSTVREFEVWAWKSFTVSVIDAPYSEQTKEASTVIWTLKDHYGELFSVNVTLFEANCKMNVSFPSPWWDLYTLKSAPAALFTFNATDENPYIKLRVTVEPKIIPKTTEVEYFNAYDLMKKYGINYILLDKRMLKSDLRCEGWWGEFDKNRLESVFENERGDNGALILEVMA
jgi:hypothetical protein